MLLRFRTKEGTFRVPCQPEETLESVVYKVITNELKKTVDSLDLNSIHIQCNGSDSINLKDVSAKTVISLNLKHGDMLTMNYKENESSPAFAASNSASVTVNNINQQKLPELPVDISLKNQTGLIPRKKLKLCKHGDKGMCEYCAPLPPWDKEYQLDHGFKHISFHAYLKSLEEQSVSNKSKNLGASYIHPLSQPNFKINKTISCAHDAWPRGICSKCQPSAITLQQQPFRMCDHVQFVESGLINEFVDSWRQTGTQRLGVLYGTYEEYNGTVKGATLVDELLPPLGVKALVQAIYEPTQHDEVDGLTYDVENFKHELEQTNKIAAQFGIYPVGVIFTDLDDSGKGDGSVLCKRHKDSYFLSSLEVIMSSKFQLQHKNVCHESEQGYYSSKFVTCCVTGNLQNEIDINTYQVSVEAEALVYADMISGSTHPSLAWINDTTDKRYVPEIFYMKKNEYNLTVKENAQPAFPIEYLLVTLSHGFTDAKHDLKLFKSVSGFPWANRAHVGFKQDYYELKKYLGNDLNNFDNLESLRIKLSNFHVLLFLQKCEILGPEEWQLLVSIVKNEANTPTPENSTTTNDSNNNDINDQMLQLVSSPGWQTLAMIMQESI
uniref:Nuclear protein localization protein 4 n=1 Tax=Hanseniaspora osmophila TaxID=56408 RepID=A0A1E5R879_9ASCO